MLPHVFLQKIGSEWRFQFIKVRTFLDSCGSGWEKGVGQMFRIVNYKSTCWFCIYPNGLDCCCTIFGHPHAYRSKGETIYHSAAARCPKTIFHIWNYSILISIFSTFQLAYGKVSLLLEETLPSRVPSNRLFIAKFVIWHRNYISFSFWKFTVKLDKWQNHSIYTTTLPKQFWYQRETKTNLECFQKISLSQGGSRAKNLLQLLVKGKKSSWLVRAPRFQCVCIVVAKV